MFYSYIVVTNNKTSMMVNNLVVFFSLFLFTSPTQGKWIFHWRYFQSSGEDFFNHRQNNEPILVHLDSDSNIGCNWKEEKMFGLNREVESNENVHISLQYWPFILAVTKKEYSFNQNILHSFSRLPKFQIPFIFSNVLSYKINNNSGFEKTARKTVWKL